MILRPDLVHPEAPKSTEVIQVTHDTQTFYTNVYMEAQIFFPDCKRFLVQKADGPHDVVPTNDQHQYLICDIDRDFSLTPLITDLGCMGPSVAQDGDWVYYFVDRSLPGKGYIELKKIRPDGSSCQTIAHIDRQLAGLDTFPSMLYPLSSLSSDTKKIATACFFGDGTMEESPWGLMVFETETGNVQMVVHGHSWNNLHPQYSRSIEHPEDILIQQNHGYYVSPAGEWSGECTGTGADIHVIRDDGSMLRDLPWGRDGSELCQGHQCWRGRSQWAVTSTDTVGTANYELIESLPLEHRGHIGKLREDGCRNVLSREVPNPGFAHFATDIEGSRLVSDSLKNGKWDAVYVAELGTPGVDPLLNLRPLAITHCSNAPGHHPHPFLSPDGTTAFFNSDESGQMQVYAIRGF